MSESILATTHRRTGLMQQYFLADHQDPKHIRHWLAETGQLAPAHESAPMYFNSPDEAYHYPGADALFIHAVPLAETVPGLPQGAVCADEVALGMQAAAREAAALCRL
jgi:hypothetical protein